MIVEPLISKGGFETLQYRNAMYKNDIYKTAILFASFISKCRQTIVANDDSNLINCC